VLERLELAELYQINSLYSSCGKLIGYNMKMVKKDAKWLELKTKSPELAISIFEEFGEQFENLLQKSRCYVCGNYGHLEAECDYKWG
jgi:hypothetical protein